MKRTGLLLIIFLFLCVISLSAQNKLYLHHSNGIDSGISIETVDSLTFKDNSSILTLHTPNSDTDFSLTEIDSLTVGDNSRTVKIDYNGSNVHIINPLAFEGVTVTKEGATVIINSTIDEEIEYTLSGTTTSGSFKIYSDKKLILNLNGVSITCPTGPAINIQSGKKITVNLVDDTINTLIDGSEYTLHATEDMKGTLFSEGQLIFTGNGDLTVRGNYKHAICSDDYIEVQSGTINIPAAISDGIHVNDYVQIDGGKITIAASSDGIDGGDGYIEINGGELNITVAENTSKGLKSTGLTIINDGNITINTTGNVEVTSGDPSYCTAIKSKSNLEINGGNITITSIGIAGKGISADGDVYISNGTINITTTGNGGTYTNTNNAKDSYSATCIKADGNMVINGGDITTSSSGTAGKGISVEGTLTIGTEELSPVINVTTKGSRIQVSGSGQNADYANAKAIKSLGNLIVNNGTIIARTSTDGAEGLESKATLTINGGNLDLQTYDDAINAATHIAINGGYIYCYASGNDGVDSNGTLAITGGVIVSVGTNSPEEGFDCDRNTFKITGGIIIGVGGATSTPTSNVCTQPVVVYTGTGTANQMFHIRSNAGTEVITFKIPRSYSGNMVLLASSPDFKSNTSYSIYTGGTVSGGTDFHGLYFDSSFTSSGTATKTFTTSSMVTTVGSTSGGPGGGKW